MASTPTSRSAGRLALRLTTPDGAVAAESSLVPAAGAPDGVEICEVGYVTEGESYQLGLLSDEPLAVVGGQLEVEGIQTALVPLGETLALPSEATAPGRFLQMLGVADGSDANPFALVYALVRVELSLVLADGSCLELTSLDLPCASRREDGRRGLAADAMLRDLAEGDDEALGWMFSAGEGPVGPWGVPGDRMGRAGATDARLAAAGAALDEFEACLPAVRVQAARRVSQVDRVVPARAARRCGAREAAWLARHPEALEPALAGPVRLSDGRRLAPARLGVSVAQRSADTYENGVVLGFLARLVDDLGRTAQVLEERAARAERAAARLGRIGVPEAVLPALTATALGARRLRALADQAGALRGRAARVLRAYRDAMPDACPDGAGGAGGGASGAGAAGATSAARPRRTKVFREVALYARLWHAMEGAGDARLDAPGREELALQMLRLDSLYELYVLHRMLAWLQREGFAPSRRCERPIERGSYTVDDPRYRGCDAVAGVYRLERGDQRATLYYQPVLHGTEREEMGVTLHRLTAVRRAGDVEPRTDRYPFYTPDYLLEVEDRRGRRVHVVDAKFASLRSLVAATGADGRGKSVFEEVCLKYQLECVDARTGLPPASVWLVCGDQRAGVWRHQSSPWALARPDLPCSGVVGVSPAADCLDELFAAMGIEPLHARPARRPAMEETAGAGFLAPAPEVPAEPEAAEKPAAEKPVETKRAEPDLPSEPAEPAKPAEPAEPAQAAKTADPVVPARLSEPAEPALPIVPVKTAEPAKPMKPAKPAKPVKPAKPAKQTPPKAAALARPAKPEAPAAPRPARPGATAAEVAGMLAAFPEPLRFSDPVLVRRTFDINYPLVREKAPTGSEAKAYGAAELEGKPVYVRTRLTPVELNRLRRAAAKQAGEKPAPATSTPAVASAPARPSGPVQPSRSGSSCPAAPDAVVPELLERVWPHLIDPELLSNTRFCQRTFRLNAPLVKEDAAPGKGYAPVELSGRRVCVCTRMTPVSLNLLRKYVDRVLADAGAAG